MFLPRHTPHKALNSNWGYKMDSKDYQHQLCVPRGEWAKRKGRCRRQDLWSGNSLHFKPQQKGETPKTEGTGEGGLRNSLSFKGNQKN